MNDVKPLRKKDYYDLRELFQRDSTRNYCLFMMLFTFTLRVSDLLALKVNELLDEDGKIKETFEITEAKRKTRKRITIRGATRNAIRDWIEEGDLDVNDYIFPSPYKENQHLSRQQVDQIIKKKVKLTDINYPVAAHSGRKTIARRVYEKTDGDITYVQKLLGHSRRSHRATKDYIGVLDDEVEEVVRSLDM